MRFIFTRKCYKCIQQFVAIKSFSVSSSPKMTIKTFIFLDSETTGLPYMEHNKTKVTELCLSAIQADHIELGVYPRVQNKLMFCFNPCKLIDFEATRITGLSNNLLEKQECFTTQTVEIIKSFVQHQKQPACFVAHNGDMFDYPILRREIFMTGNSLPDDILCIDSLKAFRDLHNQKIADEDYDRLKSTKPVENIPIELCDSFDEILCKSVEEYENSLTAQTVCEVTPKKLKGTVNINSSVNLDQLYYMPSTSFSTSAETPVSSDTSSAANVRESKSKVRRKLNFGSVSFKLGDLFERLTNKNADNAHRAEDDVNMMIECAATYNTKFVKWANENCKKFTDIPMMQPGKKIGTV